ncbi:MAG: hypothetical protein LBR65_05325 [Culturomica sp.]|jgi:hypothetical protein|nr:hypothetical protein [Culturomica sp.]
MKKLVVLILMMIGFGGCELFELIDSLTPADFKYSCYVIQENRGDHVNFNLYFRVSANKDIYDAYIYDGVFTHDMKIVSDDIAETMFSMRERRQNYVITVESYDEYEDDYGYIKRDVYEKSKSCLIEIKKENIMGEIAVRELNFDGTNVTAIVEPVEHADSYALVCYAPGMDEYSSTTSTTEPVDNGYKISSAIDTSALSEGAVIKIRVVAYHYMTKENNGSDVTIMLLGEAKTLTRHASKFLED